MIHSGSNRWSVHQTDDKHSPYVLSVYGPKSKAKIESSIAEYLLNSQVVGYST